MRLSRLDSVDEINLLRSYCPFLPTQSSITRVSRWRGKLFPRPLFKPPPLKKLFCCVGEIHYYLILLSPGNLTVFPVYLIVSPSLRGRIVPPTCYKVNWKPWSLCQFCFFLLNRVGNCPFRLSRPILAGVRAELGNSTQCQDDIANC